MTSTAFWIAMAIEAGGSFVGVGTAAAILIAYAEWDDRRDQRRRR